MNVENHGSNLLGLHFSKVYFPQRVDQRTSQNGFGVRVVFFRAKGFFVLNSVSYSILLVGAKGPVSYFVHLPPRPFFLLRNVLIQ